MFSANKELPLPSQCTGLLFVVTAGTYNRMLNGSGRSIHHPHLSWRKQLTTSSDVSCSFSQVTFLRFWKLSSASGLLSLYDKWVFYMVTHIFSIYWNDHVFYLCVINMVNYTPYWLSDVKPCTPGINTLWLWWNIYWWIRFAIFLLSIFF